MPPTPTYRANYSDVSALIRGGMSEALHWFPEDVSVSTLAETMASMANTNGGVILLGVAPRSEQVHGLSDSEATIDKIFQACLLADPPLVIPLPALQVADNQKEVLWITIPAGLPHIYTVGGRYLGREGRHTSPIPARTLRRKLIERGILQFESRVPPGASYDDLDHDQVQQYIAGLDLPKTETADSMLLRRGCLQQHPDRLLPTYAGLALFGKHPQQWLPNAIIMAVRFSGVGLSDQFVKQEITGTLPHQLTQAENFVRDNLRTVARLVGMTREETPEYPLAAVRELLVNAVAHRDYNIQGDSTHLHIFSNRLEVHSPGVLPGPVNLDNLLESRFSRNPIIVQVLSDMGYIERLGYGLDRVVNVMREHNLKPPQFKETVGTFRVILNQRATTGQLGEDSPPVDLSAYKKLGISPRQEFAIRFLTANSRINSSEYKDLCPDVHAETLRRDLVDLVKKGIVLKVGSKRGTYYILKEAGA